MNSEKRKKYEVECEVINRIEILLIGRGMNVNLVYGAFNLQIKRFAMELISSAVITTKIEQFLLDLGLDLYNVFGKKANQIKETALFVLNIRC